MPAPPTVPPVALEPPLPRVPAAPPAPARPAAPPAPAEPPAPELPPEAVPPAPEWPPDVEPPVPETPPDPEPPLPEPPIPEPPLPDEPPEPLPPSPDVPPAPPLALGPEQEAGARARLVTTKALSATHVRTATTASGYGGAAARREAEGTDSRVGVTCRSAPQALPVDRKEVPAVRDSPMARLSDGGCISCCTSRCRRAVIKGWSSPARSWRSRWSASVAARPSTRATTTRTGSSPWTRATRSSS